MNFKNLLTDNDAVSPVIGVILMVAITVILAAVIGTFVLGLGDQVSDTSPQASFTFDFTDEDDVAGGATGAANGPDDYVTITHDGGDKISASTLTAKSDVAADLASDPSSIEDGASPLTQSEAFTESSNLGSSDDVSAGTQVVVGITDGEDELNDATVRIVWSSSNGGDSATLGKWTGPDA